MHEMRVQWFVLVPFQKMAQFVLMIHAYAHSCAVFLKQRCRDWASFANKIRSEMKYVHVERNCAKLIFRSLFRYGLQICVCRGKRYLKVRTPKFYDGLGIRLNEGLLWSLKEMRNLTQATHTHKHTPTMANGIELMVFVLKDIITV